MYRFLRDSLSLCHHYIITYVMRIGLSSDESLQLLCAACPAGEGGGGDDEHTGQRGAEGDVLADQEPGPDQAEDRLHELHLPDAGDTAHRQAGVPGEEAEVHAEGGEVGQAPPGCCRSLREAIDNNHQPDHHGQHW